MQQIYQVLLKVQKYEMKNCSLYCFKKCIGSAYIMYVHIICIQYLWYYFFIFSSLDNFVFIFRIAKLKGITTEKPDPPSDSSDEDEDDEDGAVSLICLE